MLIEFNTFQEHSSDSKLSTNRKRIVNVRPSHRFQFGFACVAFPFYYSSSLQLFSLFFIHSNTVKSCFQAYVLSSTKIFDYFSNKKAVMLFQVDFAITAMVGFQFK